MTLEALRNLGLPEWFIISAVLVYILDRVGLLKFAYSRFSDSSEHKQQSEDKQTEHLQKSQSDALSSSLGIADRLTDHLMETNNGRLTKIEERQGQIVGLLRNVEGQQAITNRDWSRMEEILSDIDAMLSDIDAAAHQIQSSLKINDAPD